ncbi:putative cation-transporting ATPase 13A4, partial [Stegodyphus mimosarum]
MALEFPREELEKDLQFLGLIILENSLKPETIPSLNVLRDANIRSIMITGDNLLTAITVGRKCGMIGELDKIITVEASKTSGLNTNSETHLKIEFSSINLPFLEEENQEGKDETRVLASSETTYHFAMEGNSFEALWNFEKKLLDKILLNGTIFARMLPDQKRHLIEALQNLEYQVGMCGDGANDCGALKTAHTGVSLSVAEVSAAAPFTSSKFNIECIPTLIREGRAALVSVFDTFRYMVCYSFIFLIAVLWLFWDGQRCSDGAYVLIDVILNLTPPFLIGATWAFPSLAKRPPTRSLISIVPLFSIFSFIA